MADFVTTTVYIPNDPAGDDKQIFALKAPSAANGGGITIREAKAINGAATSSSNGFAVALHKYTNAGTPALSGTIAAAVGGTTDHWAAGVPKDFSIDSDEAFLNAGEHLVLQYNEDGTGTPTNLAIEIVYEFGR